MSWLTSYYFATIFPGSPPLGSGSPRSAGAAASQPRLRPLAYLLLAGFGLALGQCQPAAPTEQPAARTISPDSLKLETAVAAPIPKFDVEGPILRQLALLPAAERSADPAAMRRYQQLTRRFWLAQYSTEYLLKEAQKGHPNLPVFAQQLATTQGHWRVLREGLSQAQGMPPTMADHLRRMQQTEQLQQAALADLQADGASQRPPALDAATLAAQSQVAKLLAPLRREPAPLNVRIR
ncbi:hypothetical protein [Hymenobacter bucti]|uniref:DUF4142 domain-containing protein n=1 Tax=Hymenobacter bucti TaxID=1844114 RepID=A0ABW4QY64_9BACT